MSAIAPRATAASRRSAAAAILFVLLVVAAFADPLFARRNFAGRDLLPYNLPVEKAIHDAWARGRLPVWWSDVSGGRPLLPNPNAGALYPGRALLAPLSFPSAMRLYPVAHWIVAGLGTMALLSALGASAAAQLVGAASYAFSGVSLSEVFYSNYHPGMALLPWIVWAIVRLARPGGTIVLGLVYGLDLLAGDAFTLTLAAAASAAWILLETPRPERGRGGRRLAAALCLAGLLAAPQLVASALWAPLTRRAVVGLKLDEALAFTLSPWRLLEAAIPYPFGATWSLDGSQTWGRLAFRSFFATLYAGALAPVAVVALARERSRGARWMLALLAASVLLAVGPSVVPRSWGDRLSPIPLRYPEKFAVGIAFALAVAAGLALDRFRDARRVPRGLLAVAAALTVFAVAARAFPGGAGVIAAAAVDARPPAAAEAARQLAPALAEGGLLWIATVVALELHRSPRAVLSGAAAALLALLPLAANRRIARTFREDAIFARTPFERATRRLDPRGLSPVLDLSRYLPDSAMSSFEEADPGSVDYYRRRWSFYTPSLWGRRTIFNTDPDVGDLSRTESLRELSSFLASSDAGANLFASLGLRFGIRFRDQPPLPGWRPIGRDGMQEWTALPRALSPIRLLSRWREEPAAVPALRELPRLEAGEIALETGRAAPGAASGGRLEAIAETPERLTIALDAVAPTWLFVARGFWPYRRVEVDGARVEPVPAHLAFTAIPVAAGRHRIEWREEVPGWSWSALGPVAFLAVAAAGAVRRRRRVSEAAA